MSASINLFLCTIIGLSNNFVVKRMLHSCRTVDYTSQTRLQVWLSVSFYAAGITIYTI